MFDLKRKKNMTLITATSNKAYEDEIVNKIRVSKYNLKSSHMISFKFKWNYKISTTF